MLPSVKCSFPNWCSAAGEAEISISNGRCPTLDAVLPQGAVPNDVELRGNELRAMVISGPNMGGKSSYMCQVGLTMWWVLCLQCCLCIPCRFNSFSRAFQKPFGTVERYVL